MSYLYESSDSLNTPIECYTFDSEKEAFPVKPHWHYFIEIALITEGKAVINNNGNTYHAGPGDLIIFNPQNVHAIYASGTSKLRMAVVKFDINRMNITGSYTPKLRSIYRYAQVKNMQVFFTAEEIADLHLSDIFTCCILEMSVQQYGFDLIIRSKLYEMLVGILRLWQKSGFVIDSAAFAEDDRFDIYNITEYIDEHMSENIPIPEIAKMCGMSYSYFAKNFMAVYGKTCKKYIEEMRLFRVEELLNFTDFDLTYIAQETGFSDCSHLIKSFSAHRGITPKQFRMQARNVSSSD